MAACQTWTFPPVRDLSSRVLISQAIFSKEGSRYTIILAGANAQLTARREASELRGGQGAMQHDTERSSDVQARRWGVQLQFWLRKFLFKL